MAERNLLKNSVDMLIHLRRNILNFIAMPQTHIPVRVVPYNKAFTEHTYIEHLGD